MKPNQIRIVLLVALAFIFTILYGKWNIMFPEKSKNPVPISQQEKKEASTIPTIQEQNAQPNRKKIPLKTNSRSEIKNPIKVSTNVFQVEINPVDGVVSNLKLLKYSNSLKDKTPLNLLSNSEDQLYLVQSGIINPELNKKPIHFNTESTSYSMGDNKTLKVSLLANVDGLDISKTFIFTKGSYNIKVIQSVKNNRAKDFNGRFYGQILRKDNVGSKSMLDVHSYSTFTGATLSSTEDKYQKESYKNIKEASQNIQTKQGWASMVQHYFISAWVPENATQGTKNTLFTRYLGDDLYTVGAAMPAFTIKPGESSTDSSQLYVGPAIKTNLDQVAPNLSLTVDYGWLWFISDIIFWAMSLIYHVVGNWGLAIILVTFLIKLMFYPLSAKSYRSMAKMRLLQPKIKQLKEHYGDDKQKMTQQMMQMYKREKVNPVGGCLPMIVQIPVFIALYWVLLESVQLRQAPFIFWIHDLSVKDPYYILPILMGLSMFAQQRLNPAPPDPMQAKIMMFMPVIFTVMFLNFPSGLVLYWLTNNILGITQQWWVMKQVENEKPTYKSNKS
jgi:YidC/Oxa1 family membrane protein insertase